MKRNTIKQIIRNRYKKINSSFCAMHADFSPAQVHAFRVQVKKLRAFLHLVSTAKGGRHVRKVPGKLRQAYILAGRIRTYQLQEAAISAQLGLQAYAAALREHTQHLQEIARLRQVGKRPFKRGLNRLEKKLPKKLNRRDIQHFFNLALLPLQHATVDLQLVHPLRKNLKDLQYNIPLAEQYLHGSHPLKIPLTSTQLATYTDLLGRYLDAAAHVELIHSDRNAQPPGSTTAQAMEQLEQVWHKAQHKLHQELSEALPLSKKKAPLHDIDALEKTEYHQN